MVSIDQIKRGLTSYIDDEILPGMPAAKRYGLMVYLALFMEHFHDKAI